MASVPSLPQVAVPSLSGRPSLEVRIRRGIFVEGVGSDGADDEKSSTSPEVQEPEIEEARKVMGRCMTAPTNSLEHLRNLAAKEEKLRSEPKTRTVDGLQLASVPLGTRRRRACVAATMREAQAGVCVARMDSMSSVLKPLTEDEKSPKRKPSDGSEQGYPAASGSSSVPVNAAPSGPRAMGHTPSATQRFDRAAEVAAAAAAAVAARTPTSATTPYPSAMSRYEATSSQAGPAATGTSTTAATQVRRQDTGGSSVSSLGNDDDAVDVFDDIMDVQTERLQTMKALSMATNDSQSPCPLSPTTPISSRGTRRWSESSLEPVTAQRSSATPALRFADGEDDRSEAIHTAAGPAALAAPAGRTATCPAGYDWRQVQLEQSVSSPQMVRACTEAPMQRTRTMGNPFKVPRRRAATSQQLHEAARTASMLALKQRTERALREGTIGDADAAALAVAAGMADLAGPERVKQLVAGGKLREEAEHLFGTTSMSRIVTDAGNALFDKKSRSHVSAMDHTTGGKTSLGSTRERVGSGGTVSNTGEKADCALS